MNGSAIRDALAPALDSGACPHMAVLLKSEEEFAPVVASFYSLGAKRGGWLVHRSAQPRDDRRELAQAGLDVDGLEAERRLAIEQLRFDEPPDRLPRRIDAAFDDALGRGLNALWSSHTPVAAEGRGSEARRPLRSSRWRSLGAASSSAAGLDARSP